ncbi:unnamed protein product [Phytophthora lilii]|uniref:Unnamed protein product n=1 Tax=Phytophthora lilii TaxID=2077276 RepID=A0A9W6WMY6_9STRA|nr:unnamed protein product [Phytophthora lilii]
MDTLHAQKENVDANVRGGIAGKVHFAGSDKFSTPKRGFVIHEDSKSTDKKGLQESSTKKRRVLGDISNKQQNRQSDSNAGGIPSVKKTGLGRCLGHSKKLSAKKKTPLKTNFAPLLKPKTANKPPQVEEVPVSVLVEVSSAYLKGLHDEIVRDILNDKTPTFLDEYDPARVINAWDDEQEKKMLESGEPPSPWWSPDPLPTKESEEHDTSDEKTEEDDLNELPPPDNLPDDTPDNFDEAGLLDDILSVDVEAACTE